MVLNKIEETKKKESLQQKSTPFQRERVDLLIQEFVNRFPPFTMQETQKSETEPKEEKVTNQMEITSKDDQPVEKKMKLIG